jgi:SAM-dependent methyltransferase
VSIGQKIRLNIGCGGRPLAGYVNVDMDDLETLRRRYPAVHFSDDTVLVNYDIFNLPYEDGSVDEIRADAFLEHLSFVEEPKFFFEVKRVLRKSGRFHFSVPDFEEVCRIWLAAKDDWRDFFRTDAEAIAQQHWFGTHTYAMDNRWGYITATIFGPQFGEGQFHKNCYSEGKIRAICARLGFEVEKMDRFLWKGDRDPMLHAEVVKLG